MARLAQASIRFRRYEIGPEQFERLSLEIDAVAARAAREIYGPAVEVDVVVEAGSLLVRITVIGGLLLGIYDAISKYQDFKEGVVELVEDAQKYGSTVVNEVLKVTGAKKVDGVVKRDMTPGKLLRVIEKLERVKELEKHASKPVIQEELRQIARDVLAIERDLQPEEVKRIDHVLESRGLRPLDKLPKPTDFEDRTAIVRKYYDRPPAGLRERGRKLRHHNRFVVGERTPRISKR